jgi:hypothetical protein
VGVKGHGKEKRLKFKIQFTEQLKVGSSMVVSSILVIEDMGEATNEVLPHVVG